MAKQLLLSYIAKITEWWGKSNRAYTPLLVFIVTFAISNIPFVERILEQTFTFLHIGNITLTPSDIFSMMSAIGVYLCQKYRCAKALTPPEVIIKITIDNVIEAIVDNRIEVVLQPTYRIATDKIIGFESLIRMHHKKYGTIKPLDFLKVVETADPEVSHRLTAYVIEKTAEYYEKLVRDGHDYQMSINLMPDDLTNAAVLTTISKSLMIHDMPFDRLTVEISERSLTKEMSTSLKVLASLDSLDVKVSLDDYGTHIVSFMRFKDFLIDEVKIDSSLTHHIDFNQYKAEYIRAIAHAAHGMGAYVTAKHIETQESFDRIKQAGCDCVQGYFIAPPMTITDTVEWLKTKSGDTK